MLRTVTAGGTCLLLKLHGYFRNSDLLRERHLNLRQAFRCLLCFFTGRATSKHQNIRIIPPKATELTALFTTSHQQFIHIVHRKSS